MAHPKNSPLGIFSDFQNMVFPEYCLGCHGPLVKGEDNICTGCRFEISVTDFHLLQDNPLMQRFMGKVELAHALSYTRFVKGGRIQRILHALKYKNSTEAGVLLGKWYGHVLAPIFTDNFDLIIPVPLHASRLKTRGYNQSEFFGQGLSEVMGVPMEAGLIVRKRATASQTRMHRFERWQNVGNVFDVTDTAPIKGAHVLLVDDVVTTGSTLEACAHALQSAGARAVSIATIAMAT